MRFTVFLPFFDQSPDVLFSAANLPKSFTLSHILTFEKYKQWLVLAFEKIYLKVFSWIFLLLLLNLNLQIVPIYKSRIKATPGTLGRVHFFYINYIALQVWRKVK